MLLFAQAAEQRPGQRAGQRHPVALAQVWRNAVHGIKTAEQPGHHTALIAVRHRETFGTAEQGLHPRMFIEAMLRADALRRGTVKAVQWRAQALPVMPQIRRIVGAILAMDLPALLLIIEQGQRQTGDMPALGDHLQLFADDHRQTHLAAGA
ncbi:hypothetical protein D3C72_675380 [compost metagenome]